MPTQFVALGGTSFWPQKFQPQASTVPSALNPRLCDRPELTATKTSTEVPGMPATEVPTAKGATHVSPAEATTPVASCKSKTAGQGEREEDRQDQGGKPTNPGGQRPIGRRKRHEVTVVGPWWRVKGVSPVFYFLPRRPRGALPSGTAPGLS